MADVRMSLEVDRQPVQIVGIAFADLASEAPVYGQRYSRLPVDHGVFAQEDELPGS